MFATIARFINTEQWHPVNTPLPGALQPQPCPPVTQGVPHPFEKVRVCLDLPLSDRRRLLRGCGCWRGLGVHLGAFRYQIGAFC
jgi:hypothetical protein